MAYHKSTKKFNKCVNHTMKWCRKHKRKGQTVTECAEGVCGYIKRRYK